MNYYSDNDDLRFYMEQGIDWAPLVRLTEMDWRAEDGFENLEEATEFYRDALELVGGFAAEEVAPKWRELDQAHAELVDGQVVQAPVVDGIFEQLKEMGLHAQCLPRELGGLNAPVLLFQLQTELMARADVSVCAHHGFHGGMAMAALMYSVLEGSTQFADDPPRIEKTRFENVIREIAEGQAWGSMDITEPDAGSDMAALRCRAHLDDDGTWRINGEKIFITSGHGRWHFVIARTEDPKGDDAFAGLAGLSMFLVPAWTFDDAGEKLVHVHVDKVEEKLGHGASATVALRFEDAPAQLIGERGQGFRYMLLLMNNARVGVGFESIGLCEAALDMARRYAAERPSMGKTLDRHEMIADWLDEMQTDIQGLRALAVQAGWHEEMSQKLEIQMRHFPPTDPTQAEALAHEQKGHQRRARRYTPLLKYLAAEKAVEMARRTVQIHGGCGYMREYGAEKLLRDAVVMPIYEGTSQIQGLMAMKDTLMGAVREPTRFMRRAARARWRARMAGDPLERATSRLEVAQDQAVQFLLSRLAAHKLRELRSVSPWTWSHVLSAWDPKRDFGLAMLHAERLAALMAHVSIAQVLLDQADRHPHRREVLARWLERAEPRVRHLHDLITTTGGRLLEELETDEPAPETAEAAK